MSNQDKIRRTGKEKVLRDNLSGSDKRARVDVIRDDSNSCDRGERRRGRFIDQNAREGDQDKWKEDHPRDLADCTPSSRSSRRTTSTSSSATTSSTTRSSGRARKTEIDDLSEYE